MSSVERTAGRGCPQRQTQGHGRFVDALLRIHYWLVPKECRLGWFPYLWLPYSAFLFVDWLTRPPDATGIATTVAALIVLLVLYFRGYRDRSNRNLGFVAGAMLALALTLMPVNSGAAVVAVYAAAFAGGLAPRRLALMVLIFVIVAPSVEAHFINLGIWVWAPPLFLGLLVGLSNIHFNEVGRKDSALRRSHEEIRSFAARAERERIARDLHDLLGHTLSVVALKAELAGRLIGRNAAEAAAEVREVERIARNALAEVRAAVHGYRAGSFSGELANARVACAAAGIELDADIGCECSPTQAAVLAPVLREGVTNVIRHAHAHRVDVSLSRVHEGVRLTVRDDGRGGRVREGHGIAGMRERLLAAGGRLHLEQGETGVSLVADLPGRVDRRRLPGEAAA